MNRSAVAWSVVLGIAMGGDVLADKRGVAFGGKDLRFARAKLYQSPYGNVTLDIDLSEQPMRCDRDPATYEDRGHVLTLSLDPGPKNSFFAGPTPIRVDVYPSRAGERANDGAALTASVTLAPFAAKGASKITGRIDLAEGGGGTFATTLCPIKDVKLPVPPPEPTAALAVVIDGKPWRPAKVLALHSRVDKKPVLASLWIVDAGHTCAEPTGPGSIGLWSDAALQNPGTVQPTRATITPPTGDATYAAITSLAWLRLDLANGEVRGSFAARQDAAKGSRWEASGQFTAERCPAN